MSYCSTNIHIATNNLIAFCVVLLKFVSFCVRVIKLLQIYGVSSTSNGRFRAAVVTLNNVYYNLYQ